MRRSRAGAPRSRPSRRQRRALTSRPIRARTRTRGPRRPASILLGPGPRRTSRSELVSERRIGCWSTSSRRNRSPPKDRTLSSRPSLTDRERHTAMTTLPRAWPEWCIYSDPRVPAGSLKPFGLPRTRGKAQDPSRRLGKGDTSPTRQLPSSMMGRRPLLHEPQAARQGEARGDRGRPRR